MNTGLSRLNCILCLPGCLPCVPCVCVVVVVVVAGVVVVVVAVAVVVVVAAAAANNNLPFCQPLDYWCCLVCSWAFDVFCILCICLGMITSLGSHFNSNLF